MKYEIIDRSQMTDAGVQERLNRDIFPVTSELTSYAVLAQQVHASAEKVEELSRNAIQNNRALVAEFRKQYDLFTILSNKIRWSRTGEGEFPAHYRELLEILETRLNQSIIKYFDFIGEAA